MSTRNDSSQQYGSHNDSDVIKGNVIDVIESVSSPIIIIMGLIGSAVGTATLLRVAGLRCRGIGHLLVAICVSDAIFLASLLPMWLGRRYGRYYDLYNSDGWCEFLSLTTMSSNFLSTWFMVALSVERYVAVRHCCCDEPAVNGGVNAKPTTRMSCGPTRTRVAIISLTVLAIVVFVNMVVNIGSVKDDNGVGQCVPLSAVDAMRILTNVDLVVNVIVPNVILTVLYITVGVRLLSWNCRRNQVINHLVLPRFVVENTASLTEYRLTKTAVLLSAVVLLLSAPSHVVRVVAEVFRIPPPAQIGGSAVQVVLGELFHASFAVPFFVVFASHNRIRRTIILSVKLMLESMWKRLQVASCSCTGQAPSQTTQTVAIQPDSTVFTS